MGKTGKKMVGVLALIFGIIILVDRDLLAVLVGAYMIIVGIANLVS